MEWPNCHHPFFPHFPCDRLFHARSFSLFSFISSLPSSSLFKILPSPTPVFFLLPSLTFRVCFFLSLLLLSLSTIYIELSVFPLIRKCSPPHHPKTVPRTVFFPLFTSTDVPSLRTFLTFTCSTRNGNEGQDGAISKENEDEQFASTKQNEIDNPDGFLWRENGRQHDGLA